MTSAPWIRLATGAHTRKRQAHRASSTLRQRARALAVVWLVSGAARAAPETPETPPGAAVPPRHASSLGVHATVHAGYALRIVDGVTDDRAHGAAASVVVDSPPLLWGFGVRAEGLLLAFPGAEVVRGPLALLAGGPALSYRIDETEVQAAFSIAGLAGAVVDEDGATPTWGAAAGLHVRWPLGTASALDARLVLPVLPLQPRFPLQAAALVGLAVSPDRLVAGLVEGERPASLLWTAP